MDGQTKRNPMTTTVVLIDGRKGRRASIQGQSGTKKSREVEWSTEGQEAQRVTTKRHPIIALLQASSRKQAGAKPIAQPPPSPSILGILLSSSTIALRFKVILNSL